VEIGAGRHVVYMAVVLPRWLVELVAMFIHVHMCVVCAAVQAGLRHRTDISVETNWDGILLPKSLHNLHVSNRASLLTTQPVSPACAHVWLRLPPFVPLCASLRLCMARVCCMLPLLHGAVGTSHVCGGCAYHPPTPTPTPTPASGLPGLPP
jgi:hypothetical protein